MVLPLPASWMAWVRVSLVFPLVALAGCVLKANKPAVVLPAPKPAVVEAPPPEAPLSSPQTVVTLPSRQDFNPDSIPKTPVVVQEIQAPEKPETPPPPRVSRRAQNNTAGSTKPEAEAEPETPAAPVAVAPAPAQEQEPVIRPILSPEELNRIKHDIEDRKKEINEKLVHIKTRLSSHDQTLADRIRAFVSQCDEAAGRGDYTQADALSERALVLVRELQVE